MSTTEHSKNIQFKSAIAYSDKAIVSKKILAAKGGNISLFAFDKDEALSEHTAPFDALVQILDGNAKITIDGIENDLVEGQSIVMPADIPHALLATERFKMLLTMIKN